MFGLFSGALRYVLLLRFNLASAFCALVSWAAFILFEKSEALKSSISAYFALASVELCYFIAIRRSFAITNSRDRQLLRFYCCLYAVNFFYCILGLSGQINSVSGLGFPAEMFLAFLLLIFLLLFNRSVRVSLRRGAWT